MLFLALLAISLIKTSQCIKATPGQPVPNADVLDDLLSKYLGDSYSNNALFDYILGQPSQDRGNLTGDNLDINILDVSNVRKIIAFAKKKHETGIMAAENSRRGYVELYPKDAKKKHENGNNTTKNLRRYAYEGYPKEETYEWNPYITNRTFNLMKTTIYMTKEKINQTRPFRKIFRGDYGYRIALLYGASAAILGKMEALYSQMKHFLWRTHFVWFLIMYEKILACNVDIADSIEKLFILQGKYEAVRGAKDKTLDQAAKGEGNLTRDELKQIMKDPDLAAKHKDLIAEHQKRFDTK